ncbi:RNA polymerase sigma factor [Clavibacter phaseoli]|uniref:RNA polymerase sigma factor n=2 Tax=Clavibacter phaseoli TaxID=1734031 RepID=UPI001F1DE897|nr:sigma-70 family RNA polymerase sigma factor [Clavibacter phaseoli]UKF32379.1 sigma-70 family RNA polymerase sigma factor [Clavibacter phaseoli]UKF38403.1 sigma-70 family RNA polymerase sigma factor [Clavibacter phaseoli]
MQPFDRVVTEHGAVVLRVCRAVLGGHADAEDAWSETFLSALLAYPRLGPRADVRAWLVTIAHRKALDAIRARGRRAIPVDEVPERVSDLGVPGSDDPDPDLWRAVAALPERQRLAVAYRYLGGLPHAEVAAIVGGTPEAVRRAAADGVASLRRSMGADPPGGVRVPAPATTTTTPGGRP